MYPWCPATAYPWAAASAPAPAPAPPSRPTVRATGSRIAGPARAAALPAAAVAALPLRVAKCIADVGTGLTPGAAAAARALATAAAVLPSVRSAKTAALAAGTAGAAGSLSPLALTRAFDAVKRAHAQSGAARASHFRGFTAYCSSRPKPLSAKVTFVKLKAYLIHCLYVKNNKAHTLASIASNIKKMALTSDPPLWAVSEPEYRALTTVDIPEMRRQLPSEPTPGFRLTDTQFRRLVADIRSVDTPTSRLTLAATLSLVFFQSRAADMLAPGSGAPFHGAVFGKTRFELHGLGLEQQLSKDRKLTLAPYAKVALCLPDHLRDFCTSSAVHRHLILDHPGYSVAHHAPGSPYALWPVFAKLEPDAAGVLRATQQPLTVADLRVLLLPHLQRCGIIGAAAAGFDMDFGRPTGSDLLHDWLHLMREETEETGGWSASKRGTQKKHYIRTTCASIGHHMRTQCSGRLAMARLAATGRHQAVAFCCTTAAARSRGVAE